jgi:glycosyltransferase involved in cell wall biosynthesis
MRPSGRTKAMATAVIDLDVASLPSFVEVDPAYARAYVLIRLNGNPVGAVHLPLRNGRAAARGLKRALVDACGWQLWERWLADVLELPRDSIPPGPLPSATVAVCTRDRPVELRCCLEALAGLRPDGQQLLVVDSAPSSDAAQEVVAEFPGVDYVREEAPGLNVARQRALREARGDVVAFTDDDAQPDPEWLHNLLLNFDDPLVLCVTGLTMPLELETPAQEWFERTTSFSRGFTRRRYQAPAQSPLVGGPIGAGVNMALRRAAVLNDIGGFDPALDAGTPTRSGGDHDLFMRVLASGYRIVYDPAALVWHRHRRSWRELRDTVYGYGVGVYAAWTRALFVDGELTVPAAAWRWFWRTQLRTIVRSLLRRRTLELRLALTELAGCAVGPFAYASARRRVRHKEQGVA